MVRGVVKGLGNLVDLLELNIEEESCLGWDVTGEATITICVVAGDVQSCLLAELHGGNTLIPTLNDFSNANGCDESTAAN